MVETRLPFVASGPTIASQDSPQGPAERFFMLMVDHPEQGRRRMVWLPTLRAVALARCRKMPLDGWNHHADPHGYGPNYRVREFGYKLPYYYGTEKEDNNIESLRWGGATAEEAFEGLLTSPNHRTHLLGLDRFYAQQEYIGVGYYYAQEMHYWCIITCPPQES